MDRVRIIESLKNKYTYTDSIISTIVDEVLIASFYDTCDKCKWFNDDGECEELGFLPDIGFGCNRFKEEG